MQSNREIYDMLLQRARETSIEKDIRPTRIRVLDPADLPRAPVSRIQQTAWVAGLVGLVLAVGLVIGLEQLDNRFKTPDEIETHLGLPLLGFVPEVRLDPSKSGASPIITNGVPPFFVEAIRSVRTDVLFSFTNDSLKTIVVTSATLSEGKTVIASNLAIALAQAGSRVLLIDGDMRRPHVHSVFKLKQEPGLSNILVGNAVASVAVKRSEVPNLWILPAGHRPPNPPELLGSPRFRGMLDAFAQHFDWVLIDAPPIMPVSDARVLAQRMAGVLFVVGAERVGRQVVQQAVEKLARVNANIVGGILTRVDLARNSYYYSNYYHRRYSDYYSSASRPEV
jgi:capsular exopolysaccharide synthesis family protein